MRRLILPDALAGAIEAHVARAYPEEGCGLLLGRSEGCHVRVDAVEPSPNRAADPRRAFEIDPALLLRRHREGREGGLAIAGLFHSHPDGAAAPSMADTAQAWIPRLAWMILAVSRGRVTARAAFWRGDEPRFETMEIAP